MLFANNLSYSTGHEKFRCGKLRCANSRVTAQGESEMHARHASSVRLSPIDQLSIAIDPAALPIRRSVGLFI